MTKLAAWKQWCKTAGTSNLATEFTLERSSHGKAFSFAWDAAVAECAAFVKDFEHEQLGCLNECAAALLEMK